MAILDILNTEALSSVRTKLNAIIAKINGVEDGAQVNTVDSVAGKTGAVSLVKADVGLSNVDNTADSTKNVLSATKLTTARTIALSGDVTGSVSFDGSANATITATVADDSHNHVISNIDGLQAALDGKLSTAGKAADSNSLDGLDSSQFLRSDTSDTMTGALTISGSTNSGAIDFGYYQASGTNIVLQGDANGRSGIFFQSEKDGTNINHPSDYGFIQFHAYGFNGTSGESNRLVIGVANDSTDEVVLQTPYNNGVKIGYRDAGSGTGLTLGTVWHSGNDGSGSGLDADLLDGQQGSFYQNASNLNAGTVPSARLPNATSTAVGGVKARLDGTSLYLTTNGNNA